MRLNIMTRGKKTVATKVVYGAFDQIEKEMKADPKIVFEQAIRNVSPILEVKGRRIGGANYQVPMEVQEPRKTALGMKWVIDAARAKKGKPMAFKLATELMEAYNKQGAAIKSEKTCTKWLKRTKPLRILPDFRDDNRIYEWTNQRMTTNMSNSKIRSYSQIRLNS